MAKNSSSTEQSSFEKARFEYCANMFEKESERKEILERKSQFYLSFITIFLGAFFLNLDFLVGLSNLISQKQNHNVLIYCLYSSIVILAFSLLAASIAVLESIRVRIYKNEYPVNFISSLFSPDTKYLDEKTESSLYKATAMSYAIALELSQEINAKKAKWIKISSTSIFIAIVSLMTFSALVIVLSLIK